MTFFSFWYAPEYSDFVETLDCCNFEFCYGDELVRSSIYSIENLNSTDLAGACSMSNGSQFGLRGSKKVIIKLFIYMFV